MLQLENRTDFPASLSVMADADGVDTLLVCSKATYRVGARLAVAKQQRPLALRDEYRGAPASSSLLEAGDLHIGNAGTDVVLHGHAYAPGGRPATTTAVQLDVADRSLKIAVFGDRQWRAGGRPSSPEAFERMPLTYERALGGLSASPTDATNKTSVQNPAGVGLDRRNGAKLPNLEDPRTLLVTGDRAPQPVGIGPVAPHWQSRAIHGGTFDQAWSRRRAPLLPKDFSSRFFNVAWGPLAFDRFLRGGEIVRAVGMTPTGELKFELPPCPFRALSRMAGDWTPLQPHLERVVLRPDDELVTLTWRAKLRCDRRVLQVESVRLLADTSAEAAA